MDDNIVTVLKFLKKVDVDYEEYGENIIGDISYNAIKKLLSDFIYLKEENEKLRGKIDINISYTEYLEKILNEYKKESVSKQKVKDKIRHYQELQDNYIKKYDEINEGLQAMINVLQELIEEREEE